MLARLHHSAARRADCCVADARTPIADPTGTLRVRKRYRTLLDVRWRKLGTQVRDAIVAQDMLGLGPSKANALQLAMSMLTPDGRARAFQQWLDNALLRIVVENDAAYLDGMVETAYRIALKRAQRMTHAVVPNDMGNVIAALQQLTLMELQGIAEAVSQNLVRIAAQAHLDGLTPGLVMRQMQTAIAQIGINRSRSMVEVMAVKTHSQATLDTFEAAGVKRVGLLPEAVRPKMLRTMDARVPKRPVEPAPAREGQSKSTVARIRREEARVEKKFAGLEVEVLTAGDDLVCPECEEISAEGPYTIDEARSLIPAHPNCRCAFVPEGSPLFSLGLADDGPDDEPRDPDGRWTTGGGGLGGAKEDKPLPTMKEEHSNFRTVTKGTNDAQNERIVKDNGVKIELGGGVSQRDANEAIAHIVTDSKSDAALLSKATVKFRDMGPRLRGNQSGNVLSIDSKAMKDGGPGYASGIIKHELEHKRLTDAKVPSGRQEDKVKFTAGAWAARQSGNMYKTNPVASKGFHMAAKEQGIAVGKW